MTEEEQAGAGKVRRKQNKEDYGEQQCWLTFFTTIPQGDGTVVLKPQKPTARVTVRQAAKALGISDDGVRRLIRKGILQIERPTPHKTYILAESLEVHLTRNARNPEFWEAPQGHATWKAISKHPFIDPS